MDARNNDFDFDFTPIGQAIKKARTSQGMTREQLARIVDYDPRHLQATSLPFCAEYSQVERVMSLSPYSAVTPVSYKASSLHFPTFDIDASSFHIDLATLSRWLCKKYQRTQKSRLLLKSIRISGFVICLRHIQFSFSWSVHL